jgi:hypothetical protein
MEGHGAARARRLVVKFKAMHQAVSTCFKPSVSIDFIFCLISAAAPNKISRGIVLARVNQKHVLTVARGSLVQKSPIKEGLARSSLGRH